MSKSTKIESITLQHKIYTVARISSAYCTLLIKNSSLKIPNLVIGIKSFVRCCIL